ncbi:hypothetical protein E2C01_091699 [Portunus trituberculatus]|uniref:Uncharacterized protein n=1 Tax=Portunus trituberculatus TaxID=210409 RepID=A0A5B7JEM5_PORTR|nr:hypothetical protein [Portunus trituberculatus]
MEKTGKGFNFRARGAQETIDTGKGLPEIEEGGLRQERKKKEWRSQGESQEAGKEYEVCE